MDLNDLKYKKDSLELPDRPSLPSVSSVVECGSTVKVPELANYSKEDEQLSPSLVFIISGGSETEKSFFKELISNRRIGAVKVLFLTKKNQGLQPYQMNNIWKDALFSEKIVVDHVCYTLTCIDKAYLISDVDEFESQLEKILGEKDCNDWGEWIISNPSFEMWLYYCYRDNAIEDLAELKDLDISKRSQRLSSLCHSLVPGGMNPVNAFKNLEDAICRSRSAFEVKESGVPKLYSTGMHILSQYILDVMEERNREFTRFLEDKKRDIERYRRTFKNDNGD